MVCINGQNLSHFWHGMTLFLFVGAYGVELWKAMLGYGPIGTC